MGADRQFEFGRFRFEARTGQLWRGESEVKLSPRAASVLHLLAERGPQIVTKQELFDRVWDGIAITDDALTSCIQELRRALGDDARRPHLIETRYRRGYRLMLPAIRVANPTSAASEPAATESPADDIGEQVFPVGSERLPPDTSEHIDDGSPGGVRSRTGSAPALSDKPSIAVLPFQNMSSDPGQEYFVDGMVEEIITALSRIRWLFVIARNSGFIYKDQVVDVKRVGHELGVRYVLEGSVRKAGGWVRITAQLIEATTGAHLWADRFDGSLEDVFDLQDKVATAVAGVVEPVLQAAETARLGNHLTTNLSAYQAYLRGYSMLFASAKQIPQALASLEHAITRDPNYGPALAFAAHCCMRLCMDGSSKHPESDRRKGVGYARQALRAAGDDPGTLATSAMALAFFGEDIGAITAVVDRALMLNPSFARGWHISSMLRSWAGQSKLAIEHAEIALHLSPRGGIGSPFLMIGIAHLRSRRFDEALAALLLATQGLPTDFPTPYRLLAACHAHMGQLDEAREVIRRLQGMTPLVIEGFSFLRNPEHRELVLSGLRLAASEPIRRSVHQLSASIGAPMAPRRLRQRSPRYT